MVSLETNREISEANRRRYEELRKEFVANVSHDYPRRIRLVEAIPESVLLQRPDQIRERLSDWRHLLGLETSA